MVRTLNIWKYTHEENFMNWIFALLFFVFVGTDPTMLSAGLTIKPEAKHEATWKGGLKSNGTKTYAKTWAMDVARFSYMEKYHPG